MFGILPPSPFDAMKELLALFGLLAVAYFWQHSKSWVRIVRVGFCGVAALIVAAAIGILLFPSVERIGSR